MTEFLYTEFAALIARTGLTPADLAAAFEIDEIKIHQWENGWQQPPAWCIRVLILIDRALLSAKDHNPKTKKVDLLFEILNESPLEAHEILGVSVSASVSEIDSAKADLVEKYHPRRGFDVDLIKTVYQAHDQLVVQAIGLQELV